MKSQNAAPGIPAGATPNFAPQESRVEIRKLVAPEISRIHALVRRRRRRRPLARAAETVEASREGVPRRLAGSGILQGPLPKPGDGAAA